MIIISVAVAIAALFSNTCVYMHVMYLYVVPMHVYIDLHIASLYSGQAL